MRRVRYQVAASLDGYIAGPNGEYDWIPNDAAYEFEPFLADIDTIVMGRASYEPMREHAEPGAAFGDKEIVVCSRTLDAASVPDAVRLTADAVETVRGMKGMDGKDIWVFGGGLLFRDLLAAGLVDTVEVAVMPVLLGRGIPLLAEGDAGATLRRTRVREYPLGAVLVDYEVARDAPTTGVSN